VDASLVVEAIVTLELGMIMVINQVQSTVDSMQLRRTMDT